MSAKPPKENGPPTKTSPEKAHSAKPRQERLAAALKRNIGRRKAAQRAENPKN